MLDYVCPIFAAVVLYQVYRGGFGRESSGSPILVAENVSSATTHVSKVWRQKKKISTCNRITFVVTLLSAGDLLSAPTVCCRR